MKSSDAKQSQVTPDLSSVVFAYLRRLRKFSHVYDRLYASSLAFAGLPSVFAVFAGFGVSSCVFTWLPSLFACLRSSLLVFTRFEHVCTSLLVLLVFARVRFFSRVFARSRSSPGFRSSALVVARFRSLSLVFARLRGCSLVFAGLRSSSLVFVRFRSYSNAFARFRSCSLDSRVFARVVSSSHVFAVFRVLRTSYHVYVFVCLLVCIRSFRLETHVFT